MTVDVVVVGAGLAGLLTAVELDRRGLDVHVIESAPEVGGIARSIVVDGHRLEPAAGTLLLPHPALTPILDHAGVATSPVPAARARHVYTHGGLVRLAPGPALAAAPYASPLGKLRALGELLVPHRTVGEDESLHTVLTRRLGPEVGGLVSSALASGVFAGDARSLSARATFPELAGLASGSLLVGALGALRRPGRVRSTTHVPIGGMAALVDGLAAALGDRVRTSSEVVAVRRTRESWEIDVGDTITARRLVLAVDPPTVAHLLDTVVEFPVRDHRASVDVVWLGAPSEELPTPDGLGYLTAPDSGFVGLGCLFETAHDPTRAPAGTTLLKVICGGATHPEVAAWERGDVIERVITEVGAALGISPAVTFTHVVRHRPGIPQYGAGHLRWLRAVDAVQEQCEGLHVTGWSYRGIGLGRLATDAVRIASEMA